MKWLVVLEGGEAQLARLLHGTSARLAEAAAPISLSSTEVSIEVEGPDDLPEQLERHPEVKGVYPSSDMSLY